MPIQETSGRMRFRDAYAAAVSKAKALKAEEDVVIGDLKDFPNVDWNECEGDFLIHGDKVFLTACVTAFHQDVADTIAQEIADAINGANPTAPMKARNPATMKNWINHHGCHRYQDKIADACVNIAAKHYSPRYKKICAPIQIEVAYMNESFFTLMAEGAAWVNGQTDCQYCCLLKVFRRASGEYRFRLVVLERTGRTNPKRPSALKLTKGHCNRTLAPFDASRSSTQHLAGTFKVSIVLDREFGWEDLVTRSLQGSFEIDLERIYRNSGYNATGTVTVYLSSMVDGLKESLKLHLRKGYH